MRGTSSLLQHSAYAGGSCPTLSGCIQRRMDLTVFSMDCRAGGSAGEKENWEAGRRKYSKAHLHTLVFSLQKASCSLLSEASSVHASSGIHADGAANTAWNIQAIAVICCSASGGRLFMLGSKQLSSASVAGTVEGVEVLPCSACMSLLCFRCEVHHRQATKKR